MGLATPTPLGRAVREWHVFGHCHGEFSLNQFSYLFFVCGKALHLLLDGRGGENVWGLLVFLFCLFSRVGIAGMEGGFDASATI